MLAKFTEKHTRKRPPLSPLATYWASHPNCIDIATSDATASISQARAMKRDLDAVSRGAIDPDTPGLRMAFAYLAMGGALDLLDKQRAWHAEHFGELR